MMVNRARSQAVTHVASEIAQILDERELVYKP